MNQEIAVIPPPQQERSLAMQSLEVNEVVARMHKTQEIKERVMKKNVHYMVIPGTQKDTLIKSGAETLLMTFGIAAEPKVEDLSTPDEIRYRVTCYGVHIATGNTVGAGVGECSSMEEKYKWRKAYDAEFDSTPEDRRRIKHNKDYQTKQIRTDPKDVANTILKMAKKRALVDMALTVTASSSMFEQDLEEFEPDAIEERRSGNGNATQPKTATAKKAELRKKAEERKGETLNWAGVLTNITSKPAGNGTRHSITTDADILFYTFSDQVAHDVKAYIKNKTKVEIGYTNNNFGNAIQEIKTVEDGGQQEEGNPQAEKIIKAFGEYGVKQSDLEEYFGVMSEAWNEDNVNELRAIYIKIKGGDKVEDHFPFIRS